MSEGVKFNKMSVPSYGQTTGVSFGASEVQLSSSGPRIMVFGGARTGGAVNELWSYEQSTGDGWIQMVAEEGDTGGFPRARTQSTLTSIGDEPQTTVILFGGYVLNIGPENDLWQCVVGLDLSSMPVPSWTQLQPEGSPPEKRCAFAD
jgi:hypothetical protein